MTRSSGASDVEPLFAGGGLLGAAMATADWAQTPLGPPPSWPPELRSIVRMLLTSRFPMWMAWGPRLTMFYNDAYRHDTLRAKHPWALGRPASEVWAEIWDDIGPRIASVLATGVATWDEDLLLFLERSGYAEETYHTFSYSPLDERGPGRRDALRGHREHRPRVVRAADGHAARARRGARTGAHGSRRARRGRRQADREPTRPAVQRHLPFGADGAARLAATSGIAPDAPGAPSRITTRDERRGWPLDRAPRGPDRADRRTGRAVRPPPDGGVGPAARPGRRVAVAGRTGRGTARAASSSWRSTRSALSTSATGASSSSWQARSLRAWPPRAPTRPNGAALRRSPNWTGRRPTSSRTSATSSARR